jgi:dipeptidyl-peptidase-4
MPRAARLAFLARRLALTALLVAPCGFAQERTLSRSDRDQLLDRAEARLRAIYERREFQAEPLRAEWLPDAPAYVLRRPVPGTGRAERVLVDAESGAESELSAAQRRAIEPEPLRSPDGGRVLESERGDLRVRDTQSGELVRLTSNAGREGVSSERAQWSPDGSRVLFLESDASKLRFRNRLLTDDPSYPSVAPVRFARVGEAIPALRVGVVPAAGGETRWLDIPRSERGHYLGQVEWAGNSREVLVEWLSRFRDERRFLLCDVESGAVQTIFAETDPAWVVASYGVNLGIQWVREGAGLRGDPRARRLAARVVARTQR